MKNDKQLNQLNLSDIIVFQPPKMLNVPSSAIHIKNDLSLVQKKLWFELIYNSFPNMGDQRKYLISLNKLRCLLGWNETTSNDVELKEALHGLNQIAVQWNIFGKDNKNTWQSFPLLAGCEIPKNSGECIYSLSPFLEDRFLAMGEEAYVKIDLIISKKFQSKYALSIYCLALDYLIIEKGYSEKKFTIEELRHYLAVKADEYKLTADMNRWIFNPAQKEINKISDINIEIKPYKEGRKIAGYKLCMSLKEGRVKDYLEKKNRFKQLAEPSDISESLVNHTPKAKLAPKINIESEVLKNFFSENSISITTDVVQKRLTEVKNDIDNLEDYLTFLMNYSKKEFKKGNIKSFPGFFIGLLKDSTQMDNYLFYQEQQRQNKIEKDKIIERHIKAELYGMYDTFLSSDFHNYILDNIYSIKNKIIKYVDQNILPETFIYDVIIKKQMDSEFSIDGFMNLSKSYQLPFINQFKEDPSYFNYKTMTYEEWKSKYVSEESLQTIRDKILSSKMF